MPIVSSSSCVLAKLWSMFDQQWALLGGVGASWRLCFELGTGSYFQLNLFLSLAQGTPIAVVKCCKLPHKPPVPVLCLAAPNSEQQPLYLACEVAF